MPPNLSTTVFFGKTGAGKTSTVNALFGTRWATDHAQACTSEPSVDVLDRIRYPNLITQTLRVVDLPGIGESLEADERYLPHYETWAARADRLVWITQADTRAYKRDELFLERLRGLFKPSLELVICLNKIDDFGVDDGCDGFDQVLRQPSNAQLAQMPQKIEDVFELFSGAAGRRELLRKENILPYSAKYGWGLKSLSRLFFLEVKKIHV